MWWHDNAGILTVFALAGGFVLLAVLASVSLRYSVKLFGLFSDVDKFNIGGQVVRTHLTSVMDGSATRRIAKKDMFNTQILDCPVVDGKCKGGKCGHYRKGTTTRGDDICRALALEFYEA